MYYYKMWLQRQLAHTWGYFGFFLSLLLCLINVAQSEDLLELSCHTTIECGQYKSEGIEVHCSQGRCICSEAGEKTECRPRKFKTNNIVAGSCPCTVPDAECNLQQQVCYCKPKYVPSLDRRRCLSESIPLNMSCELDLQCQNVSPFAKCHIGERICLCLDGYVAHYGKCLPLLDLNCTNDSACGSCGDAICLATIGKCICSANYALAENGSMCVPPAYYGASCTSSAQCQLHLGAGGICESQKCTCRQNYYMKEISQNDVNADELAARKICKSAVKFGSYCRNDTNCQEQQLLAGQTPTMECSMTECVCKLGYISKDDINCVPKDGASNLIMNLQYLLLSFVISML